MQVWRRRLRPKQPRAAHADQRSLPGLEHVWRAPRYQPQLPLEPARSEYVRTPIERIHKRSQVAIEELVEFYARGLCRDTDVPIDRLDIVHTRMRIEMTLKTQSYPIPPSDWIDEFIIELCGWWFEHPLADDVPSPAIECMPD